MRIFRHSDNKKCDKNIDEWYQEALGQQLFNDLKVQLDPILATSFGYYSIQIGCASQAARLLESCRVKRHFSLGSKGNPANLQACPGLLPIANDSVDLIVLMHSLSNSAEPHAILREVSRVLIPEGKLIIVDFNPLSLWGLRHFFQSWLEQAPWRGHYYSANRLTDWMQLLGFDLHKHLRVGYMPPIHYGSQHRRRSWIEKGLRRWFKFSGALNLLVYDFNIAPMTPVRHRWVARKLLAGKIARPNVGRGMKYDK